LLGDLPTGRRCSQPVRPVLDLLWGFRGEGGTDHKQDPVVGRGANSRHWNLEALDPEQAVVSTGGAYCAITLLLMREAPWGTRAMAWGARKSGFLEKITPLNAESVIQAIGKGWYAVAAIQAVAYGLMAYLGKVSIGNMIDPLFCLIGGYFLIDRKSRSLAAVLLLYASANLAMTIMNKVHNTDGGRNVLLAVVIVFFSWKGLRATWIYHSSLGCKIIWKRVVSVYAITAVAAAVVLLVALIAFAAATRIWPGFSLADELLGDIMIGLVMLTATAIMALLTRRYPFVSGALAMPAPVIDSDPAQATAAKP
jgi:hypothetical protein